jgi:pyrroloquinoline quinone biosynthesis protein B
VVLNSRISVTPFQVPHRGEYSETVGYRIDGPSTSVVFIPDIDAWEQWERRVEDVIADVDVAYLDGTFFGQTEIPGRDLLQIPHPFIQESLHRFADLSDGERSKIRFIHLNHTNPALDQSSRAALDIAEAKMRVAVEGERVDL